MNVTEPTMSILLVDDEARLRQTIARSLRAQGYRVEEAATYGEAVPAATDGHYDLLIVDVNLPDATGWDVLRGIAGGPNADVPVIVISAVPPSVVRLREFRPFGVLHKPFPIDSLHQLVIRATPAATGIT